MKNSQDTPDVQTVIKRAAPIAIFLKVVSFLIIVLLAVMLAILSPEISRGQFLLGLVVVLLGLPLLLGFESASLSLRAVKLAHIVTAVALLSALWGTAVTTKIVDTIVISRASDDVLAYAASVKRWPEWHPQSLHVYLDHTRPLAAGEGFEEDIDTPIGKNHMVWNVKEYRVGSQWLAQALNQDNGAQVLLQYKVASDEQGRTVFERTLEYTLNKFYLVAANAIYMHKEFERKSEDALVRLKQELEATP